MLAPNLGGSKSSAAMPCALQCLRKAGKRRHCAHAGSRWHCRWAAKPLCRSLVTASASRPAFCARSTPGKHLGHCTTCSGDRLATTFCVQVYRQVKTDKCAKVTQQTQCLSFLEYKKNKIQQLSLLGYGNTTCFFVSFFFFAFSPLHFFYSKSRLDLYKIRSGEKMPHRKKKKKCR